MEVDEIVVRLAISEGADEQETIKKIKESFKGGVEVSPNRVEFFDLEDMLERIGMESEMKEKRFVDSRPEL